MKHAAPPRRARLRSLPRLALGLLLLPLPGCGIGVARDLATMKPAEVVFDDACGLQPWFKQLANNHTLAPRAIAATDIERGEGERALGGRETYRFEPGPARDELLRLLGANWKRLPPRLEQARRLDLEVTWARKAAIKRLVTEQPATLFVDGKAYALPYQICLGDFLYGEPLYKLRGQME